MKTSQLVRQLNRAGDASLFGMVEITMFGIVLLQDSNVRFHDTAVGKSPKRLTTVF